MVRKNALLPVIVKHRFNYSFPDIIELISILFRHGLRISTNKMRFHHFNTQKKIKKRNMGQFLMKDAQNWCGIIVSVFPSIVTDSVLRFKNKIPYVNIWILEPSRGPIQNSSFSHWVHQNDRPSFYELFCDLALPLTIVPRYKPSMSNSNCRRLSNLSLVLYVTSMTMVYFETHSNVPSNWFWFLCLIRTPISCAFKSSLFFNKKKKS